jgi:hypothetical protein
MMINYIAFMCFVWPQNKQKLVPYMSFSDWFLLPQLRVFTKWYALSPYIKQECLVHKELNQRLSCDSSVETETKLRAEEPKKLN